MHVFVCVLMRGGGQRWRCGIDIVDPSCHALYPISGMNRFLTNLDITFRRDPTNYRPRINKYDSTKDREQKEAGTYYYIGDD